MQNNVYFCSLWTFWMSLFLRIFHLMMKGSSTADIHLSSPVIQEPIHYLACLPTLRVSSFWVCFKDHLSFEWRSLRAMQIFINPSTEPNSNHLFLFGAIKTSKITRCLVLLECGQLSQLDSFNID